MRSFASARVLLVGNPEAALVLTAAGFHVRTVEIGHALTVARNFRPDAVVVELDYSGVELAQRLRSERAILVAVSESGEGGLFGLSFDHVATREELPALLQRVLCRWKRRV
jgi:hypothetical protein